jgi:hypothetical protein
MELDPPGLKPRLYTTMIAAGAEAPALHELYTAAEAPALRDD